MTMISLALSVCNPIYQRRGSPPVITATTAPTLSALTDAQTPADGYTAGSYTSTAGTISSAVETYLVNGVEVASTYDLAADDVVRVSVLVTDSAGNTRTFSTGTVTVTAAASAISTTTTDTFTSNGQTFTLSSALPVGQFADGSYFIVSSGDSTITQMGDASGDLNADGYIGNGAMWNPIFDGVTTAQAFDQYLESDSANTAVSVAAFDNSLNIDPAQAGAFAITQGMSGSIIKAVRRAGVTDNGSWQTMGQYEVVTILSEAPPVGTVRPGFSDATKIMRQAPSFTPAGYTYPASFPDIATVISSVPSFHGVFGTGGDVRRLFRLDVALGTSTTNYSAEITPEYARYIFALNCTEASGGPTAAQREAMIHKILTWANDLESLVNAGWSQTGGRNENAGQHGAIHPWMFAAAAILQDETMLTAANSIVTNMMGPFFWITQADVGTDAFGSSNPRVQGQTFFAEHVGMPAVEPDEDSSAVNSRYAPIAAMIGAYEIPAVLAFNQGPASRSNGLAMILNGGANDNTNQRAAAIQYYARYRTLNKLGAAYNPSTDQAAMWDQLIPALSLSMWEGVPDQPINGTGSGESTWTFFDAPSDGAIRFTKPATMDFTTEPQTQIDWGYSLDGVQYVEELDVGTPYTKSGLLRGVQHFCRWRMQSTSGPGVWSPNYAREADGNYANTVTTTGTATAAAPAFTVNPSIHARLAPNWNVSKGNWYPVSGTLAANEVELSCGLGYTSGYPAPSYTFQWKRDGVDISGATSQTYRRGVYDASAVLTCTITATNASGSTSYTTAGVTCPAETPLPDTKLIDTDFGWEFASDYSAELDYAEANQQGTNPVVHDPTGVIRVEDSDGNLLDQSDTGLLRADKAGAYPSIYLPCKNPAKPGTTYNWTAQYVQDGQRGGRAYQFDIRSVSHTGSSVIGGMLTWTPSTTSSEVTIRELSGSFTIGAGATGTDLDLYIYARNNDNNGGSGGGDPVITRLLIEEA